MGSLRISHARVFARLSIGVLGSAALVLAGPSAANAHAMTPASFPNTQADTLPDVQPDALPKPPFGCQKPGAPRACYGPDQIRAAYDIPTAVTGAGTTIVIIDGFQSPTVKNDLRLFDAIWSLPSANLTVLAPDGHTPPAGSQVGWWVEEAVDVEWAHVIAPDANLVLVEAKTGDDADILSAIKFAIDNNLGDVISMSFSEAESCPTAQFLADEHAAFERATASGITLVAASGDTGGTQPSCDGHAVQAVATPASDPLVTAVGGTRLFADGLSGQYQGEVAWDDKFGASGGGFSSLYRRPAYQAPFQKNNGARGLPDVALSASGFGFAPAIALNQMGASSGTSAPTAEWAGIVALADQAAGHRLGAINEALYHACKSDGASDRYHMIGMGWDTATGLGSPDVANLVDWVAAHF